MWLSSEHLFLDIPTSFGVARFIPSSPLPYSCPREILVGLTISLLGPSLFPTFTPFVKLFAQTPLR